jgi:hypothetical protein
VTSSNPGVIAVSGSNTEWLSTAKSPGTATVTIRDQRGYYTQITYTVLVPMRQVRANIANTTLFPRDRTTFTIIDGNGGYTVTSSNPGIIATTGTGVNWVLTAMTPGEATITVRDQRGSTGWIRLVVKSRDLILSTTALTVEVGSDAYFRINSGNGGYMHSMNNSNVGWYHDDSTIPSYRVEGLTPGTTFLQIRDGAGKVGQVVVTVTDVDLS